MFAKYVRILSCNNCKKMMMILLNKEDTRLSVTLKYQVSLLIFIC